MGIFLKACGAVLISVILVLIVGKSNRDFAMILTIMVCCMVAMAAMEYIRPVLDFLNKVEDIGGLDHNMIGILLKIAGIGLISDISSLVCADSGSTSLGKIVKILSCAVILWLSLPLYAMFIELLQRILGTI